MYSLVITSSFLPFPDFSGIFAAQLFPETQSSSYRLLIPKTSTLLLNSTPLTPLPVLHLLGLNPTLTTHILPTVSIPIPILGLLRKLFSNMGLLLLPFLPLLATLYLQMSQSSWPFHIWTQPCGPILHFLPKEIAIRRSNRRKHSKRKRRLFNLHIVKFVMWTATARMYLTSIN